MRSTAGQLIAGVKCFDTEPANHGHRPPSAGLGQKPTLVRRRPRSAAAWTADIRRVRELHTLSSEFPEPIPRPAWGRLVRQGTTLDPPACGAMRYRYCALRPSSRSVLRPSARAMPVASCASPKGSGRGCKPSPPVFAVTPRPAAEPEFRLHSSPWRADALAIRVPQPACLRTRQAPGPHNGGPKRFRLASRYRPGACTRDEGPQAAMRTLPPRARRGGITAPSTCSGASTARIHFMDATRQSGFSLPSSATTPQVRRAVGDVGLVGRRPADLLSPPPGGAPGPPPAPRCRSARPVRAPGRRWRGSI